MKKSVPCLKALTAEARMAIGGTLCLIPQLPFRVGRESRSEHKHHPSDARRSSNSIPNNDLYLAETDQVMNVSREHFLIDIRDGGYVIVDKGSTCGTIVEGELVGDKGRNASRILEDNDVIIVGTSRSNFIFKFVLKVS